MADQEAKVKLTADADGFTRPVEEADKAVEGLDKGLDKLAGGDPLGPLGDSAEAAAKELADTRAELDRLEQAHRDAVREFERDKAFKGGFEEGSKEAQELRRRIVKTGIAFNNFAESSAKGLKGTAKSLRRVTVATTRARRELKKFADTGKRFGALSKALGQVSTAAKGFLALIAVQKLAQFTKAIAGQAEAFVRLKASIDAVRIGLEQTVGGEAAAASALDFLNDVSDKLGTRIAQLAPAFLSLTAAVKGTSVEGQATRDVFEALTEASVVLGRTQDQTARALAAVAQIAGKGTAQLEELRQQLGEQLPGSLQALAKGLVDILPDFDGTVKSLFELTAAGELAAEDAIPALTIGLRKLSGTGAEAALASLAGVLRRAGAEAEDAKVAFADNLEPGLLNFLETALESSEAVEKLAAGLGGLGSAVLDEATDSVGFLSAAVEGLGSAAREFPVLFDALGLEEFGEGCRALAVCFDSKCEGFHAAGQ